MGSRGAQTRNGQFGNLAELVAEKKFRSDLYYRLNVFPITLPPLRERTEDIPLLVHFFAQKFAQRMKKPIERIPTETIAALTRYSWPGNIRELQNLIERAVILSRGSVLEVPLGELKQNGKTVEQNGASALEAVERDHILKVLRDTNWVIGGAGGAAAGAVGVLLTRGDDLVLEPGTTLEIVLDRPVEP